MRRGGRPDRDRLRLALRLDRLCRLVADDAASGAIRRLVRDDTVHGRCALKARGGVDDVARRHAFAGIGPRVERDERLAGRDPDPELEVFLDGKVANCESGADSALGIVLMRGRCSEEGHHRIADELLDRAAVSLELRADAFVVRPQKRLHVLRIHRLGTGREPHEIAEDDGDDLAFAT